MTRKKESQELRGGGTPGRAQGQNQGDPWPEAYGIQTAPVGAGTNPQNQPSNILERGFPGGSVVKNPPEMQETQVRSMKSRRLPGEGNGNPLQNSRLWNPMDRGVWWLQSVGSRIVGQDWATKQHQKQLRWKMKADYWEHTRTDRIVWNVKRGSIQQLNVSPIFTALIMAKFL